METTTHKNTRRLARIRLPTKKEKPMIEKEYDAADEQIPKFNSEKITSSLKRKIECIDRQECADSKFTGDVGEKLI